MPRAREEWTDDVTGVAVRGPAPGATRSGRLVTRVAPKKGEKPRGVEVDSELVNKGDVSYGIDAEEVPDLRRQAAREAAREKAAAKAKRPSYRQTFKSARAAAREFFDNNADYLAEAASSDPADAVSDFFDGLEVRSKGNKWRSFNKTAKGRGILEKMKTEPVAAIVDTLTWIFGQAGRRRWDAVSWSMVDGLADALHQAWERERDSGSYTGDGFQSGGALSWYPPAAGHGAELPDLETMDPADADRVAAAINADALAEDLDRLRDAYNGARPVLNESERKITQRRIRHLRALVKDPAKIARTMLCQPEGFSRVCGYPVLHAEIGRLEAMASARNPKKPTKHKTVATGWFHSHPWRVVKDGAKFRAQWLCALPHPNAIVCGRFYKTKAAAEKGAKAQIEKKPVPEIAKGGRFKSWTWPDYATRRKRNPDHDQPAKFVRNPKVKKKKGKKKAKKKAKKKSTTTTTTTTRTTKATRTSNPKAPSLADLGAVVELGHVRELVTERKDGTRVAYTWKRPQPLLVWSPKQRALVWVEGIKPGRLRKGAPRTDGAAKVFEKWAGGEAGQHRELELPAKRFRTVGRAVSIAYTEPFGRHASGPVVWEHDFSRSDTFYQAGQNSPFVFAVTGPRLAVTARGIVN